MATYLVTGANKGIGLLIPELRFQPSHCIGLADVDALNDPHPKVAKLRARTAANGDHLVASRGEPDTDRVVSWKFFLNGLWWSGLRVDEANRLHWTDESGFF